MGMLITAVVGIPMGVTPVPTSIVSVPPSISSVFYNLNGQIFFQ